MIERSQSFYLNNKNCELVQQITENFLQKITYSIETVRLGKTLLRVSYFNDKIGKESQKTNRITILEEPDKRVYIQVKGKLTDGQIGELWSQLEKNFKIHEGVETESERGLPKDRIMEEIFELIQEKGYNLEKDEVRDFIENYLSQYGRLPKRTEFHSIANGYIKMVNEKNIIEELNVNLSKKDLNSERVEPILKKSEVSLNNNVNDGVFLVEKRSGRRKCPSCGNEGLIHEVDDKNVILFDYPRIYGKKNCCADCGYEWREC